jgi:hypothetical protein
MLRRRRSSEREASTVSVAQTCPDPRFLLFGDTGTWVWLLPDLKARGTRLQLVAMDGSRRLFLVDTAVESGDRTGGRPGKAGP